MAQQFKVGRFGTTMSENAKTGQVILNLYKAQLAVYNPKYGKNKKRVITLDTRSTVTGLNMLTSTSKTRIMQFQGQLFGKHLFKVFSKGFEGEPVAWAKSELAEIAKDYANANSIDKKDKFQKVKGIIYPKNWKKLPKLLKYPKGQPVWKVELPNGKIVDYYDGMKIFL